MRIINLCIILLSVMTLGAMMSCTSAKENTFPEEEVQDVISSEEPEENTDPEETQDYVDEFVEPEEYEEYTKAPLVFTYDKTGKYGLNILAEDFVEAKKMEQGRSIAYSVRVKLPDGTSSLKIVIKPTKPAYYFCTNYLFSPTPHRCDAKFNEWHEICPKCGGVNTLQMDFNPHVGYYQGSDVNWLISGAKGQFTFTYVDEIVHKDGNVADASVTFVGDCMIEYYENGATEPVKVKKVKVID